MLYQPVDEMSLRHLFSDQYAESVLRMRYVGPVLNAADRVEPNPDCLILDMRASPYAVRRCEFKYAPVSARDFAHNGYFDIAVTWDLPPGLLKEDLQNALRQQNRCEEVIVVAEFQAFRKLPAYTSRAVAEVTSLQGLRDAVLHRDRKPPAVFALALAARLYPRAYRLDRMSRLLAERFEEVRNASPQGIANYALAFMQTTPPFLERPHGRNYRWRAEIDPGAAWQELAQILRDRFRIEPPTEDDAHVVSG